MIRCRLGDDRNIISGRNCLKQLSSYTNSPSVGFLRKVRYISRLRWQQSWWQSWKRSGKIKVPMSKINWNFLNALFLSVRSSACDSGTLTAEPETAKMRSLSVQYFLTKKVKLKWHNHIAKPFQDHHTKNGTKMKRKGTRNKEMVFKHQQMGDNSCSSPGARQRPDQLDAYFLEIPHVAFLQIILIMLQRKNS